MVDGRFNITHISCEFIKFYSPLFKRAAVYFYLPSFSTNCNKRLFISCISDFNIFISLVASLNSSFAFCHSLTFEPYHEANLFVFTIALDPMSLTRCSCPSTLDIHYYVASAIARKSFSLGGSEELIPCILILIANAINSSRSFCVYSYSMKSSIVVDSLTAVFFHHLY